MKVAEAIRFRVDGVPKPEPRARACVRGRHASVYKDRTSEAVEAWRSEVWARANEYRPDRPLRGPIRLYLMFTLKRPKKLFRRRDPEDELACDAVCDLDNLITLCAGCHRAVHRRTGQGLVDIARDTMADGPKPSSAWAPG